MFKFIYTPTDYDDYKSVVSVSESVDIEKLVEVFNNFVLSCGYVLGDRTICISDETDDVYRDNSCDY
jgi:hypothetical protein